MIRSRQLERCKQAYCVGGDEALRRVVEDILWHRGQLPAMVAALAPGMCKRVVINVEHDRKNEQ